MSEPSATHVDDTFSDTDGSRRSPRRVAPIVVAAIAVVIAGLFVLLLRADTDSTSSADSPLLGQPAPPSTGTYADGSAFDLSRRKGSWVVLNFFTHNCVPCIREHPELVAFDEQQDALGADGAELYSIVRDSTREQVAEFFDERGGDWPAVFDDDYEFVNDFGVALVPETWIIDPFGIVRGRFISEVTAEQLATSIQSLREAGT